MPLKNTVLAFQTLGKFILDGELVFISFQERIHPSIVRATKNVLIETPLRREGPLLGRSQTFVGKIANTERHHPLVIG